MEQNLSGMTSALISRLEQSQQSGRQHLENAVDSFFNQKMKEEDINFTLTETKGKYLKNLAEKVKADVLPLYEEYTARRDIILEKRENRKVWPYIIGAVAAIEAIEFIFMKRSTLLPRTLVGSVVLESLIGAGIYWLTNKKDEFTIDYHRSCLIHSIKGLDESLQIDMKHENLRDMLGSTSLAYTDASEILREYSSPEEFLRDYKKAREADPITKNAYDALNLPAFREFIMPHIEGYSELQREARWNELLVCATEKFVEKDKDYSAKIHLTEENRTSEKKKGEKNNA